LNWAKNSKSRYRELELKAYELISKLRREHDFYVFGKQIFTFKRMSIPAGSVIELKIKIGR
jgi:hypothetical protein